MQRCRHCNWQRSVLAQGRRAAKVHTNSLKPASGLMAEIEAARSEGINGAEDDVYFVSVSYRGTAYDVPAPLLGIVEFSVDFFLQPCLPEALLSCNCDCHGLLFALAAVHVRNLDLRCRVTTNLLLYSTLSRKHWTFLGSSWPSIG